MRMAANGFDRGRRDGGTGKSSSTRDADGGLANGMPNSDREMSPIGGTSYAAAYVSGVAALVRSRFPDLNAQQVVGRITGTAHTAARAPSNLVGAGTVDAVAALTWQLPAEVDVDPAAVRQTAAPPAPAPENPLPRAVAFTGVGLLAALVLAVSVARAQRKDTSS